MILIGYHHCSHQECKIVDDVLYNIFNVVQPFRLGSTVEPGKEESDSANNEFQPCL